MWTHEESIETTATPERIWEFFSDVVGWKKWNPGIENIEIHGPFAVGTTFSMQPPGEESFDSTLVAVEENRGFVDETIIDGVRVTVNHRIIPFSSSTTRIIYSTEVTGPNSAEIGAIVTSDFLQVLNALKTIIEM